MSVKPIPTDSDPGLDVEWVENVEHIDDTSRTFYLDPPTSVEYYSPLPDDMNRVAEIVSECYGASRAYGEYDRHGLVLNLALRDPETQKIRPCDWYCYYLHQDQMDYESQVQAGTSSSIAHKTNSLMKKRLEKQATFANSVAIVLASEDRRLSRSYCWMLCDSQKLREMGASEKLANSMHALVLFHRRQGEPLRHNQPLPPEEKPTKSSWEWLKSVGSSLVSCVFKIICILFCWCNCCSNG